MRIYFSDCKLSFDARAVLGRYELYLDKPLTLGEFTFRQYTRRTNHIVTMLDSATLAQVMQYLNLAIENGKTNVTTELLNYKNEHFPDFAPLAEFTLDDL